MSKSGKKFMHWWFMAYMGFVMVRLIIGLPLGAKDLVGGLFVQFVMVSVVLAGLALIKRFGHIKH